MTHWKPHHIFSSVNKKLAWRLLAPILVVTGISGAGAKEKALPNLWQEILPAIPKNLKLILTLVRVVKLLVTKPIPLT